MPTIKLTRCPECGNAIRVAALDRMTEADKIEMALEAFSLNLTVDEMEMEQYRASNIKMYCWAGCSRYVEE